MIRRGPGFGLVCSLLVLIWASGPGVPTAGASERDAVAVAVEGGPVTAEQPPLIGVKASPGPAQPGECRTIGPCDVIPLDIADGEAGTDILLAVTLDWEGSGGNVLDAALFDDRLLGDASDSGRNELPGLLKWTSGGRGSLVLRMANPPPGRYSVTVSNATGENSGYLLSVELVTAPDQVKPGPARGSAASDAAPTTGAAEEIDDAENSTSGSAAPGVADAGRGPAPGVAGASEVPTARPVAVIGDATPRWIGLAGLGALVAVGVLAWRARTRVVSVPRFADVRLFWKLMLPFGVVVLVVGVIGTLATSRFLTEQGAAETARRLVQVEGAATGYFRDQEFALLDSARFAANVQGLPEAIESGDGTAAERSLASVASVNDGLDLVAAVAPDGRSVASLVRRDGEVVPHAGETWDGLEIIDSVLAGEVDAAGDKRAALIRLEDGSPFLVVAGPARTTELVGAVVVGRRLAPMVDAAAVRSGSAVAVYTTAGERLSSSDGSMPSRLDVSNSMERAVVDEDPDGRQATRAASMLTMRDRPVGVLAVAVSSGEGSDDVRAAALRLAFLVGMALVAITGLGYLLSRSILRTVNPLVETNRALGRGELTVRAPVNGHDELGELALGFNQMAEQLEASYQQLEQRVAERTEELHRLHRAREEFYASVSHELRTPLFAILANSELLTDPELAPDDPVERAQFLQTIRTSAEQLVARVNEILDLARSGASDVELVRTEIDPGPLLDQVATTIEALGRPAGIDVRLVRPARLPSIEVDPDRLLQILLNLGSNAVKYTPAGGEVVVDAEVTPTALVLGVSDTGIGIPTEVGDDIFEPYYVVDPALTAKLPSTGLGLFVTKRLVEAHGGTISYRSTAGGTSFRVELPRTKRLASADPSGDELSPDVARS